MADAATSLRLPPHSVEAEQSVIGALLIDNRCVEVIQPVLKAADFYRYEHRLIYEAATTLIAGQRPADVITVFHALQAQRKDEEVGGLKYLGDLVVSVPGASNAAAYARIVAQCALRRRLITLCMDLEGQAYSTKVTDAEMPVVIERAMQQLADLVHGKQDAVPQLIGDLLPGWIDALQDRASGKTDAISLGLRGVDRVLAGGARRGELIVLAARPSMGKSALVLGIMRAVAKVSPVLACSLEDSAGMMISRQVAATGRTALEHVRVPQHAPDSLWNAVADAAEVLSALPIYIDDRAGLSLADVVNKAKYVQRKAGGLGLVVVDYLQLMDDEGETRSNELARIVRGLKNAAKRLDCVVVLLSQLSREADKTNAPPRLDHLAESGAIEQAADIIGLLWRECRRNPKPGNEHTAQIEFAKNKNGATDTVKLWFDGRTQRFEDPDTGAP